jgi:hypothetical protein
MAWATWPIPTGQLVAAPVIVADHAAAGPERHAGQPRCGARLRSPAWLLAERRRYRAHPAGCRATRARARPSLLEICFTPPSVPARRRSSPCICAFRASRSPGIAAAGEVKCSFSPKKETVATATIPVTGERRCGPGCALPSTAAGGFLQGLRHLQRRRTFPRILSKRISGDGAQRAGIGAGSRRPWRLSYAGRQALLSRSGTNYFSTEENGWDFSGPRNVLGMGQGILRRWLRTASALCVPASGCPTESFIEANGRRQRALSCAILKPFSTALAGITSP